MLFQYLQDQERTPNLHYDRQDIACGKTTESRALIMLLVRELSKIPVQLPIIHMFPPFQLACATKFLVQCCYIQQTYYRKIKLLRQRLQCCKCRSQNFSRLQTRELHSECRRFEVSTVVTLKMTDDLDTLAVTQVNEFIE